MSFEGWKEYKLKEVATFYNGRAYKNEEFKQKGTPIARIQNLTGEGKTVYSDLELEDNKYIDYGDLIYAWSATFGPYIWKKGKSIYHYHIWKIECKKELLDKTFFYYKLKQISNELKNSGNGTLFVHITKSFIENFSVRLPDLPTQKKIASILSSLDNKIELNRQTNEMLEAIAQALFKEWFVDFNFPGATGEMVESELGMIPKGWKVNTLGNIYKTTSGGTPSRAKMEFYSYGSIPWIKSKELGNTFIIESEEKITEEAINNSSAKILSKHSVLIAMYGATIGKVSITSMSATCNQAICAFLPNEHYPYTFIYLFLKNNKEDIISKAVGSAQQNISQDLLKRTKIILPPSDLLYLFDKTISSSFTKIENNHHENSYLHQIRRDLLYRIFTI